MKSHTIKIWTVVFLLGVTLAAFVLGCVLGTRYGREASPQTTFSEKRTLASILDEASFASFNIDNENFNDSCFIIEAMLREKLPETDVADAKAIASNLRILVGTYRKESQSINCPPGASLRQVLRTFVSAWDVAAFLDGNIIIFGEAFDKDRFKHEAAVTK